MFCFEESTRAPVVCIFSFLFLGISCRLPRPMTRQGKAGDTTQRKPSAVHYGCWLWYGAETEAVPKMGYTAVKSTSRWIDNVTPPTHAHPILLLLLLLLLPFVPCMLPTRLPRRNLHRSLTGAREGDDTNYSSTWRDKDSRRMAASQIAYHPCPSS